MGLLATILFVGSFMIYFWFIRVRDTNKFAESDFKENALFGVLLFVLMYALLAVILTALTSST